MRINKTTLWACMAVALLFLKPSIADTANYSEAQAAFADTYTHLTQPLKGK